MWDTINIVNGNKLNEIMIVYWGSLNYLNDSAIKGGGVKS